LLLSAGASCTAIAARPQQARRLAIDRFLLSVGRSAANRQPLLLLSTDATNGQTDGRTTVS